MSAVGTFLTRTRGKNGQLHITDILSYLYLALGTFLMFGPVLWLVLSSFKTSGEINTFPPRLLPYKQELVVVVFPYWWHAHHLLFCQYVAQSGRTY